MSQYLQCRSKIKSGAQCVPILHTHTHTHTQESISHFYMHIDAVIQSLSKCKFSLFMTLSIAANKIDVNNYIRVSIIMPII